MADEPPASVGTESGESGDDPISVSLSRSYLGATRWGDNPAERRLGVADLDEDALAAALTGGRPADCVLASPPARTHLPYDWSLQVGDFADTG